MIGVVDTPVRIVADDLAIVVIAKRPRRCARASASQWRSQSQQTQQHQQRPGNRTPPLTLADEQSHTFLLADPYRDWRRLYHSPSLAPAGYSRWHGNCHREHMERLEL